MLSDSFQSPNAIPPRTSSTGMATNGSFSPPDPRVSVLKPLPEGEWVASSSNRQSGHTRRHSSIDGTRSREEMWSSRKEKILLGPYDYIVQQPGKDIRRQFINAFNAWLKVPEESLTIIAKVVQMLHTASLLVDDVEDSSVLRRGIPVAHNIFGTAQTINSANYVYFQALQEIQKLNNPAAIDVFVKELLNLHRGQGMDLYWRDSLTCPSEDEYLEMVGNKTGGLFRLAVKLMQAESETNRDCVPLVNLMGLIFQICDDYLNLSDTTYSKNKGLCEDLTEGKFSFPIIHSIRTTPQNLELISILKQKTADEEVKLYAVSIMERTGSFAYTRKVVAQLREKAIALINTLDEESNRDGLGDGSMVGSILDKIVESTLKDTRDRRDGKDGKEGKGR